MTVGLIMIVKNEEKTLPRLAESVRDQIDYWTIVDTGSTDDTADVVDRVFAGVSGEYHRREWLGFGPSKNEALVLAEPHTDWLLWLDADETLGGTIQIFDEAITDWIDIQERNGDLCFWKPRLFKSNRGFRFTGMVHEYLSSPVADLAVRNSTFWVVHHADGGTRHEKFSRDLGLLQQEWEQQLGNPRTAFYLARTYEDMGDLENAIYWYRERNTLGGWDEEIFYSRYRLGVCLLQLTGGILPEEGIGHLWRAWGMKPERAEPLVALAEYYRRGEMWTLAYEIMELAYDHCRAQPNNVLPGTDGLFVDVTACDWRCAYEQSISAWYLGRKQRGHMLTKWLLEKDIPEPFRSSTMSNSSFYE